MYYVFCNVTQSIFLSSGYYTDFSWVINCCMGLFDRIGSRLPQELRGSENRGSVLPCYRADFSKLRPASKNAFLAWLQAHVDNPESCPPPTLPQPSATRRRAKEFSRYAGFFTPCDIATAEPFEDVFCEQRKGSNWNRNCALTERQAMPGSCS